MDKADIGLIGLAVMGQNLALNIADHGYRVAVYNRTAEKLDAFLQGPAAGASVIGAHTIPALAGTLQRPRAIMLMVKAGAVVDEVIGALLPHLEPGDCLIDGGNSNYQDSIRRCRELEEKGILFIGTGVSGGEEGARHGPSLMPGGNPQAWPLVRDIFQDIAAKVGGEPCCRWVGPDGAGHYVKMVHNGIEYGDMQLISEAYALMRHGLGMSVEEIQQVFAQWDQGVLDSYLIEITAEILKAKDTDGAPLVDKILDTAGQKGTGRWTAIGALESGVALTLITEAVFARVLSAMKDERVRASQRLPAQASGFDGDAATAVRDIHDALYASKICSYAQGYMLLRVAGAEHGWKLDFGDIALMWRGGCIIRSRFLDDIKAAFDQDADLENLLQAPFFRDEVKRALPGWRRAAALSIQLGIPAPAVTSALAFYDGYRSERLPANLLQAQRDYFGAHTYERVDRPRGEHFHTDWAEAAARSAGAHTGGSDGAPSG